MASEIPWVDNKYLTSLLEDEEREGGGSGIVVSNFTVKCAVPPGSNYSSVLYRIHVDYKTGESNSKQSSFIAKMPLKGGVLVELGVKADIFGLERTVYQELLPKFFEKTNIQFGPKLFDSPDKTGLVLQDLGGKGYRMCERSNQLDFPHCKKVIVTIAKYHAASVAFHRDSPDFIENIGKDMLQVFMTPDSPLKMWMESSIKNIAGVLKGVEGCEKHAEMLLGIIDHGGEVFDGFKPKSKGLNVLNHGDLWINNFLFKYSDSGEVEGVKLIDFPLARWGPPATDLLYFFWTSANKEVRDNKQQQELFHLYVEVLNTTLENLDCKERLTWEELKEDFKNTKIWALAMICQLLPSVFTEPEDAVKVEELGLEHMEQEKQHEALGKMYQGKRFLSAFPTALSHFQDWFLSLD